MNPNWFGNAKRNLTKGSVAVAVLALVFSADAYLPDTVPPIFVGQASAANANSNGNGKSSNNNGNGGRSAGAPSDSGNASSPGGPASGRGQGGGLLRLLTTGSARPSSAATSPGGVATGAPMQLLPPHVTGAVTDAAIVWPPDPKPIAPVQLLPPHVTGAVTDAAPVGPPDRQPAGPYLQAGADSQAALTANDDVGPTYEDNLAAAATMIEADSSFNATVDAFKALSVIIEAFEEAENQSSDE